MSCRNYWDARIYRGHSGVTQRNGPQGLRHDDDDDDDDNPQLYLQLQTALASTVLCLHPIFYHAQTRNHTNVM